MPIYPRPRSCLQHDLPILSKWACPQRNGRVLSGMGVRRQGERCEIAGLERRDSRVRETRWQAKRDKTAGQENEIAGQEK